MAGEENAEMENSQQQGANESSSAGLIKEQEKELILEAEEEFNKKKFHCNFG
jgi:hypothetical protein